MDFKIDENLPVETADLLRRAGHDSWLARDQGLSGSPDADVSAVCRNERRALITLDLGFGDIRAYPPADYHGLVVLRLQRQDKKHVLDVIERLIPLFSTEPLGGRLWIVEEWRVRVRGGSDA